MTAAAVVDNARFSAVQRAEARIRAGYRCEWRTVQNGRCPAAGTEVDHWKPRIRGGATTLDNAVWLCRWHNRSKGSRWGVAMWLRGVMIRRSR